MPREEVIFHDREDAGRRLAELLKDRSLVRPLVLGIPRGGVVIGAVLAKELGAELDAVLSRKLRAPHQPELAIGSIAEDGTMYLNPEVLAGETGLAGYLERETEAQRGEIVRRAALIRAVRPAAEVADRSVIVTDDGLATGSTMIAALRTLRPRGPRELIVAVPVAPADRLDEIRSLCDDAVCVATPEDFWAIGQFYGRFEPVEDETILALLRNGAPG